MNRIPGNPFTEYMGQLADEGLDVPTSAVPVLQVLATLALAHEQHQRNRLAALAYEHRGPTLPADLTHLTQEPTR